MLLLTDCPVFKEGIKQRHLPIVQLPALLLRGRGLPRCFVYRVHRATVLPAVAIVSCRRAGFKRGFKVPAISGAYRWIFRRKTPNNSYTDRTNTGESRGKAAAFFRESRSKFRFITVKDGWISSGYTLDIAFKDCGYSGKDTG